MSVQTFFEFLVQIGLIVGLFFAGPFLLFFLATTYTDHLGARGKYHRAYRFACSVYYFTDIPLLRLWIGKSHYFQLRQLTELAEKIGDKAAALDWSRLASGSRFTAFERVNALTQLALLLRKQSRIAEAEAAEAEALAVTPESSRSGSIGSIWQFDQIAKEVASTQVAQARILNGKGRYVEALALLDTVFIPEGGHKIESELARVGALQGCGLYDEAIAVHDRYEQERRLRIERLFTTHSNDDTGLASLYSSTGYRAIEDQLRASQLLTSVMLNLDADRTEVASGYWSQLPERMDDTTRALRHAVGAWLSAVRGDREEAEAQIVKAESAPMRDDETRRVVAFTLARAEFALGQYARAAERLEEPVRNTAHIPLPQAEYRTLLASAYAKMGRVEDARAQYGQVIAAGFEEAAFTRRARTESSELPTDSPDPADSGSDAARNG